MEARTAKVAVRANLIASTKASVIGHLHCEHLTGLDMAVANGLLAKPHIWDPLLELLWERGARHEREYVESLIANGFISGSLGSE
ncbi:hypothetical protein CU103_09770 [Phyllobacterium sophorae]|uniref:Uncharacterized protein n=1 Tax=Phyllobacterium sophorae TaxID=1520277 RepID=A0A2P7BFN3_9HYPH|nr:hypothetical protein CU103_09770 [Phyllobacterium sophorae]